MHQLDPAPRVDQAAKLLEQLRQRLLEDPTDSRVQRDLLRVERIHRALLEYQRDLDERRAPTVEVPADGDPGSILDRYPTSPGSESLPEDYWQVREYGFRQEAFEDSIVLIGYELRKPVSRPAKDFYIAVFAMLSSLKTQSMGSKLFAQHLEGRFEQLATDPEVRSEMEMARMQAKKGGKSPALPSKKLRELMLVESSLRVAEVWGREPLVKMALIYLVSLFEGCLVNIVAEAIEADERLLYSSKKPLDSKELLTLTSLDELRQVLRQNELTSLSDFSECVKFLQTRMRISVTTSEAQEKTVREIRARRHLVVHNRGLVNAKYLEETGGAYQLDTPIPIPLEYLEDAVYNLCLVVIQVDKTALQENYCKPAKVEPNIPSAMDNPI